MLIFNSYNNDAGHLEKLGSGLFGRWQKHFFKLNNHHLVYYKSQKAYSNEMLPLNNYDLKFMEKVDGAVGRIFVLKITSNFNGEKEEKKFRAQTPGIAGEWVREINRRIEYYHDLMMHTEDVSSTSSDVVAELEDVVVSTKIEDVDEAKVKIHHSGWLNKLGRDGLKWKRRWIVLRDNEKDNTYMLSWHKHVGTHCLSVTRRTPNKIHNKYSRTQVFWMHHSDRSY